MTAEISNQDQIQTSVFIVPLRLRFGRLPRTTRHQDRKPLITRPRRDALKRQLHPFRFAQPHSKSAGSALPDTLHLHPKFILRFHTFGKGDEELDGVFDVFEVDHFDDAVHVAQGQGDEGG